MKRMCGWLAALLLAAMMLAPAGAQGAVSISSFDAILGKCYTCEKGDSGSNVLKVKKKLQSYGYFRAEASLSEEFNDTMVQRVKLFQENNSLEVTGKVDSRTCDKLNSGSGIVPGEFYTKYWSEPDVTLIIPENTYGQWREQSGDRFNFRIKVKNISLSRTVKAIEFYVYTKDVWGSELISKSYPYSYTVETTFKPGAMGYTGYMTIPDRRETQEVYIAVHKVRYSDGSIEYVSSPRYYCWDINW